MCWRPQIGHSRRVKVPEEVTQCFLQKVEASFLNWGFVLSWFLIQTHTASFCYVHAACLSGCFFQSCFARQKNEYSEGAVKIYHFLNTTPPDSHESTALSYLNRKV